MIFQVSVTSVILSLFWFAASIFGFLCCLYAAWMLLDQLYQLFKG